MSLIEQAIENCHMTHKYENPGIENGMCAGLRTMNGEGEPPEECKECRLYYGYADEHDIKQTNADRIRFMTDEELADILYSIQNLEDKVKFCKDKDVCTAILDDGDVIPDAMCKKCLVEWLQSEVEK